MMSRRSTGRNGAEHDSWQLGRYEKEEEPPTLPQNMGLGFRVHVYAAGAPPQSQTSPAVSCHAQRIPNRSLKYKISGRNEKKKSLFKVGERGRGRGGNLRAQDGDKREDGGEGRREGRIVFLLFVKSSSCVQPASIARGNQ